MFEIRVSNFDWNEPPPQFSERSAAMGHARSIVGQLADMGAPLHATVSVVKDGQFEAGYSVASWQIAVKWLGGKVYT
jgi:hypothetical protein